MSLPVFSYQGTLSFPESGSFRFVAPVQYFVHFLDEIERRVISNLPLAYD
jgi:hypothetical protein